MKNKDDLDSEAKKLLSAKTPEQYISKSLESKINRGMRGKITKQWIEKTGFTNEDLLSAKNKHPYWKEKKGKGSLERQIERQKKYDFRKDADKRVTWDTKKIEIFLDLNNESTDYELAKKFKTTLPAINHIRRKIKYANKLIELNNIKITKNILIEYILRAEKILKREIDSFSERKNGKRKVK